MVLTILPSFPVSNPSISYWHTTHPNKLVHHRTTARLPDRASVVIIGSGITGAFAAKQLAENGFDDVVILEARELCSGATGRNGGHCQPELYGNQDDIVDFELQNLDAISKLVAKFQIPCEFFRFPHGACHACYTQESFEKARRAVSKTSEQWPRLGSLLEVVDDKQRLSKLKIPEAVGAIMFAHAAGLHPYKLVTWIWDNLLRKTKMNLQTDTPVTVVAQDNSSCWKVETPRGIISASQVLLATNAYTARLLPEFSSMIVPVQGEMLALRSPAAIQASPLMHDYAFLGLNPHGDYLVQRPLDSGGHLMFGGGRHVARHEGVGISDDSYVDSTVATYLETTLPRLMNLKSNNSEESRAISAGKKDVDEIIGKDMKVEAVWTGIMGFSRDAKPWVGGVPGKKGLWLCAGYTGHGMPNASLSAKHTAQLISSSLKGEDWQEVEREAIRKRLIPESYAISKNRMLEAAKLPKIRPQSTKNLE